VESIPPSGGQDLVEHLSVEEAKGRSIAIRKIPHSRSRVSHAESRVSRGAALRGGSLPPLPGELLFSRVHLTFSGKGKEERRGEERRGEERKATNEGAEGRRKTESKGERGRGAREEARRRGEKKRKRKKETSSSFGCAGLNRDSVGPKVGKKCVASSDGRWWLALSRATDQHPRRMPRYVMECVGT